jgi:hypothetical protein
MLEAMNDLPEGLLGLRAKGKVSKDDYELVAIPMLRKARQEGRRIRLLYQFGPEFEGFTPAGAWEDTRVGVQYLRLFERCAIVSDTNWIRTASRAIGATMPCPVRIFENGEWDQALEWLRSPVKINLDYHLLPSRGVLVVEPKGKLRPQDFDSLQASVDDWIERAGGTVEGMVVHATEFPGWEDLGSALRHIQFVKDYHKQIPRIAWATDSRLAEIPSALAQSFTDAEIKRFDADALDDAIEWASGGKKPPQPSVT